MSAAEYQKRARECLDLAAHFPASIRAALLEVAEAWLMLADSALTREEPLNARQNAPASERMQ
jgi:hypothetical protein